MKETFLAMVGLVRIGSMEELAGHVIVRVGKEVEIKKPISVVACQVCLAVAHVAMSRGGGEGEGEGAGQIGGEHCSGQADQLDGQ